MDKKLKEKILTFQRNEITEHFIYQKLAKSIKSEKNSKILEKIAKEIKLNKNKHYHILFSPSAASFDKFKNFEDRGNYFNYLIKKIKFIKKVNA